MSTWFGRVACAAAALGWLAGAAACGSRAPLPPAGAVDADKYLFERGTAALGERHWYEAREYFRRLVDTYPRSPFRPDAKLGIGDAFFGEGRVDSLILSANEYREFLTFFPLHPRADYAQFRLAMAYAEQVLAPRRDQTATREALREVQRFIQNYPDSSLMPDARALKASLEDRLGDAEFHVGQQYFRMRMYTGSMLRLQYILEHYPDYTRKDQVYHYIAEMLLLANQGQEALIWYEKILAEYPDSEHAENATRRIAEIKR